MAAQGSITARVERLEELTMEMKQELWGEGGRPSIATKLAVMEATAVAKFSAIESMLQRNHETASDSSSKVKIAMIGGLVSILTSGLTLLAVLMQAAFADKAPEPKPEPTRQLSAPAMTADASGE